MSDQLGLDLFTAHGPALSPDQMAELATKKITCTPHSVAGPTRRPKQLDVDARRACPVCRAAPHAPCYQHCEANRPG